MLDAFCNMLHAGGYERKMDFSELDHHQYARFIAGGKVLVQFGPGRGGHPHTRTTFYFTVEGLFINHTTDIEEV